MGMAITRPSYLDYLAWMKNCQLNFVTSPIFSGKPRMVHLHSIRTGYGAGCPTFLQSVPR